MESAKRDALVIVPVGRVMHLREGIGNGEKECPQMAPNVGINLLPSKLARHILISCATRGDPEQVVGGTVPHRWM